MKQWSVLSGFLLLTTTVVFGQTTTSSLQLSEENRLQVTLKEGFQGVQPKLNEAPLISKPLLVVEQPQIPELQQAFFCRFEDQIARKLGFGLDFGVETKDPH